VQSMAPILSTNVLGVDGSSAPRAAPQTSQCEHRQQSVPAHPAYLPGPRAPGAAAALQPQGLSLGPPPVAPWELDWAWDQAGIEYEPLVQLPAKGSRVQAPYRPGETFVRSAHLGPVKKDSPCPPASAGPLLSAPLISGQGVAPTLSTTPLAPVPLEVIPFLQPSTLQVQLPAVQEDPEALTAPPRCVATLAENAGDLEVESECSTADTLEGAPGKVQVEAAAAVAVVLSSQQGWILGSPELPTVGSAGHPVECKPCAFTFKGGCATGVDCTFCHLCMPGEKKRRKHESKVRRRAAAAQGAAVQAVQPAMPAAR